MDLKPALKTQKIRMNFNFGPGYVFNVLLWIKYKRFQMNTSKAKLRFTNDSYKYCAESEK